jgi:hypothetical protein
MLDFLDIIMVIQLIFKSLTGVGVIVAAMMLLIVFLSISNDLIKTKCSTRYIWLVIVAVLSIATLVQIWLWR